MASLRTLYCLLTAVCVDSAFLLGGRPSAPLRRARALVAVDLEPQTPGPRTASEVDLEGLDFEQRLEALAAQTADVRPAPDYDSKDVFNMISSGSDREKDDDELWWSPEFWKLLLADIQSIAWPSRKQVVQTMFISQVAFVAIVIATLLFDGFVEQAVRAYKLGEPFEFSLTRFLAATPGRSRF